MELVAHKQNRFQLTEAGAAILAESQEIIDAIANLKNTAGDYTKTLKGPPRLGCNQAIASRLIGPMLPKITRRYPQIVPMIKLGNTDQIQQMLDRREIDFGIVMDDGEVGKLYQTEPIYRDTFVVVKSPHFDMNTWRDHLIVSRTQTGGMSDRYFREYKKAYGKSVTPKLVIASWQVIMDLAILRNVSITKIVRDSSQNPAKGEIIFSHPDTPVELCTDKTAALLDSLPQMQEILSNHG